jgi:hypothetical protein
MLQPALQAVNGLLQEPGSIDLVTKEAVKQVMEVKFGAGLRDQVVL